MIFFSFYFLQPSLANLVKYDTIEATSQNRKTKTRVESKLERG
jgi:hypothetical protein